MTSKLLPLLVLFSLLLPAMALGSWDIAVESVNVKTENPVVDETVEFNVTIRNEGNESIPSNITEALNISFGDNTSTTESVGTLEVGESANYNFSHVYNESDDYTFIASVIASGDANETNDDANLSFTVNEKEYAFTGSDYTFELLPGESETRTGNVTNTGDYSADVMFGATNLSLEGGSETINTEGAVSPSGSIELAEGATYDNINLTVEVPADQNAGTYDGNLYVINLDDNDTITDIGNITLTVVNEAPTVQVSTQRVVVGDEFVYDVGADTTDPENDTLTFTLVSGPEGMTMNSDGLISGWTPSAQANQSVTFNVTDGYSTVQETFSVEAIHDVPRLEFNAESIAFGGDNAERGDRYTEYIMIENTGSKNITDVDVEALRRSGSELDSDYEASVTMGTTTLQPGESTTVGVTLTIPDDAPAQERKIGRLKATAQSGDSTVTDYSDILMEAESMLRIEEVEVEIDGDTDEIDYGDEFEAKMGDEVTLKVTLENRYRDSDNIELEDAYFIVEDDEDWDIDEESSEKDIDEDSSETFEVTFTIPYDADEDTVDLFIEAFAEDEDHGFEHFDESRFEMSIEREPHEIIIDSWNFSRNPVDCNDSTVDLDVTLRNIGENDEDEVMFSVISNKNELDWHKRTRGISIDEDEKRTETVTITLPDDLDEGSYFVELEAYYDSDELSDEETIVLDAICGLDSPDQDDGEDNGDGTENGIVVTQPDNDSGGAGQPVPNPVSGEDVSSFSNFRSSTGYMVLLAVVIVGLLVGIGYILYGAANPPKKK
ncbi:MAG: CARDB domain-containing protein [Candidatus Woesearchaeota archaeon]